MAIDNINLASYVGKTSSSTCSHTEWNGVFSAIQTKVNAIIAAVNGFSTQQTETEEFYVNGVKKTPVSGVVSLNSKGKYVLSGKLTGKVVIGTASDTWTDGESSPTQVILDGVTIVSAATDNAAIEYVPNNDKLIVTVKKNTENHLVCTHVAERADGQKGALHAENHLMVQGCGYLSCINKGGHGIKASEIRCSGNPHIYIEAEHDGVHGNKTIAIDGGVYYINKANDGFGTRAESGVSGTATYKSPGKIWLFGGEYFAYNIEEKVFDSKAAGYIFCTEQVKNTETAVVNTQRTGIVLHTDSVEADHYGNMTMVDPQTYFGQATVTGGTLSGDTYTCGISTTISGYFSDVKFVFATQSSELTLNGAYINTSVGDAISYSASKKNIKITAAKDTVNIIKVTGATNRCVYSANNIAFEPKNFGYLLMSSEGDTAVYGSEVTVRDGFGSIVVDDGGVVGSAITFGESLKTFGGAFRAGTLTARLSGKNAKGNFTSGDDMIGEAYVDTLNVAALATMNLHVEYHKANCSSIIGESVRAVEPYDAIPYNGKPIPSV